MKGGIDGGSGTQADYLQEQTRQRSNHTIQQSDGETSQDEVIIYARSDKDEATEGPDEGSPRGSRGGGTCTRACRAVLVLLKSISMEPIMFLFMFSVYLYLALIELYFYQRFGLKELSLHDAAPNQSFCINSTYLDTTLGNGTNDKVLGQVSLIVLINSGSGQVTSVVVALIAGPLSDKYGRKPALLFALLGNAVAATINMLLVYFTMSVYYFIASGLLMGATGGFTIIMTVSVAYLADVSSKRWLTLRIAILQAMLYSSQALSDMITGQWLKRSGCNFNPLLWLALASSVIAIIYLFFVKEPFTKTERIAKLRENGAPSLSSMLCRGFKIFISPKYSKWRLWLTLIVLSISVINGIGSFELLTLFQIHEPLKWNTAEIGWYGLSNTLVQAFSLFCILPVLVYCKVPDTLIVLVGLLVSSGVNFFIGFLKHSWEMYLIGVLSGLDPTIIPVIRSIFAKLVHQDDQGSLFAVVTGVQVLSAAFASVLYNTVFRQILKEHLHPGLAFVLMGLIGLIPVPLTFVLFVKRKGIIAWEKKEREEAKGKLVQEEESQSLLKTS